MKLSNFDFHLPHELIAQKALVKRDSARLFVYDRSKGKTVDHASFKNIVQYFRQGDCLVINNTRVEPVRIFGNKSTGGRVEVLLVKSLQTDLWECMLRPGINVGAQIYFKGNVTGCVMRRNDAGRYELKWNDLKKLLNHIKLYGMMPLPPYIKRKKISKTLRAADLKYYQTVYAKTNGSIAAPTAGLHFTMSLLEKIKARGVKVVEIMLHVGVGTFKKITAPDISDHRMDEEYYHISFQAAKTINQARAQGGRIFAVGTTSVRTLESSVDVSGNVKPGEGWTDIFISPGYQFKTIDCMITNFHLPKYPPFVMVSALVGVDRLKQLYKEVIRRKYRFYSYGDAMLIL